MVLKQTTAEVTKIAADTATGVTIAEVNDSNSLIITLVTIISRLVLEFIINKRTKRKEKKDGV